MKFINPSRFSLILLSIALSFAACNNEPEADQSEALGEESTVKAASADGSIQELATRSCDCYKDLNSLRQQARSEFEAGDTLAYQRLDFDLIEARKNAKFCVKDIMESIKTNLPTKDEFQDALVATCPNYATSILLMNKVNWKATE